MHALLKFDRALEHAAKKSALGGKRQAQGVGSGTCFRKIDRIGYRLDKAVQ
ncbi:MAG: hypothetical protein WBE08_05815 [Methyloceanibacter sp.]